MSEICEYQKIVMEILKTKNMKLGEIYTWIAV